jgi:integrase
MQRKEQPVYPRRAPNVRAFRHALAWAAARSLTSPRYRAIPIFATGTGLRPEEWIALERGDVDRERGVVHVRRRFSGGELKQGGKNRRQRPRGSAPGSRARGARRDAAADRHAAAVPVGARRLHRPRAVPSPRMGAGARAAGLAGRGPYTMRHRFATWAIEDASIPLAQLAVVMGTSIRELEDTYHRWLRRTDDQLRAALDLYDAREAGVG